MATREAHPDSPLLRAVQAAEAAGVSQQKLCQDLDLSASTLWKAFKGRPIDAPIAQRLIEHFPDAGISYAALTLGDKELAAAADAILIESRRARAQRLTELADAAEAKDDDTDEHAA